MRVAIISPEFPPDVGGVETYAVEYVKELSSRGHQVTVFTVRHSRGEASLPGVRIEPVLQVSRAADGRIFAGHNADVWHALNAGYAWINEIRRDAVVSVHGNDFLRPYLPVAQPDLKRMPLLWRYSAAISQQLRPMWLRLSDPIVRRSLAETRHVIANSRYTESVLVEQVPRCRGRTSVGYVGVGAHFFHVARQPSQDGIPRLLTVSRLSEARKNVDKVLQALAELKDRHPFRYTIVGDGHDRGRLERLAADLKIADRVRFAGFVSRDELLDAYARSDLMVLASSVTRDSHEGFGIVYLEAAASGVPSLAARLAGAAEAIDEGKSGMYVEEATVDGLTGALTTFLSGQIRFDPAECRSFAEKFRWARVVDHSIQYYPPVS